MRPLFHHLRPRHCVCLFGAVVIASGCVASGSNDGAGGSSLTDAGFGGASSFNVFDGGRADAQPTHDGGGGLDPRCGTTNLCNEGKIPDQPNACDGHGTDSGAPVRRRDAGTHHAPDASVTSGDASVGLDAGADGGDASRSSSSKTDEGGVQVRSLPIPEPLPPPDAGEQYSCQVARDNSGSPVHQCAPSGTRDKGMPCDQASDCAAGYACVGGKDPKTGTDVKIGQCLQYCCEPSTCRDPGTFCASRPLIEDGNEKKPLIVPVCAPGENCALLQPFPCTGSSCTCPDQTTTCAVVRADGTRGCVIPGTGKVNDRCGTPELACAAGYYCSLATSLCVKMCKTDGVDDRCNPGKCQAAAGFPTGFGLCVGYTPSVQ
jgi:hypothetical protein